MKSNVSLLLLAGAIALSSGCSTTSYTVDDGSKVNEALLSNIRLFGQGERLLRPAVERSAGLNDKHCATQWELPFSAATSYAVDSKADRVAWARALQVDERLTVIGATPGSGLLPGDKIVKLDGYHRDNTEKMQLRLEALRQGGDPFPVQTADGKQVTVTPFKVCRGLLRLAAPSEPYGQSFDWETIVHPLEIFNPDLTPDEALWMVLWTQGVSEEGGAKMKSYAFARWTAKTAVNVASLAMAGGAVVQAGGVALPGPVQEIVRMLGDAATPVALFTIGAVLWRAQQHAHTRTPVSHYVPVALVKLLVHPLLVLSGGVVANAAGANVSQFALLVLVLNAALPSASNVAILAERYGADNGRVTRIIMVSTALAFVSFSMIAWAFGVRRD